MTPQPNNELRPEYICVHHDHSACPDCLAILDARIKELEGALRDIHMELGCTHPLTPAPISNAIEIIDDVLSASRKGEV